MIEGQKRSIIELNKMMEICNKYFDFFHIYDLNNILTEELVLEFYRNLNIYKFKIPKKSSKKQQKQNYQLQTEQLQLEGLLFLLEGEVSQYAVNISEEEQEEQENLNNKEPRYSLYTYTPGEEIGQIMNFFKDSHTFRVEFSCLKDCVFMQISLGYFQKYLIQLLHQINMTKMKQMKSIGLFSHLTRDEIMLIHLTSKHQQIFKGDIVHESFKSNYSTIKIILEGEFLVRSLINQNHSQSNTSLLNQPVTDLSQLQRNLSKKNIYQSLYLQVPFDFFGLENFNYNPDNKQQQSFPNYEIVCTSQFAKILSIQPSNLSIINNQKLNLQMQQIKQNQMNLLLNKQKKNLELQNSISPQKRRQSKVSQKSLSSLEVPKDILTSPQKNQNSPSTLALPPLFRDEIMLNALSSIRELSTHNQVNQTAREYLTQNKNSKETLRHYNTVDVQKIVIKQNSKSSILNDEEGLLQQQNQKQMKPQRSRFLSPQKSDLNANQKSKDYISFSQMNKSIENIVYQSPLKLGIPPSDRNNYLKSYKIQPESETEDNQQLFNQKKRNSQSYRKNTHFFIQHLKKTIDQARDKSMPNQKINYFQDEQNTLLKNDSDLYLNQNIQFQQLLPHVDSIQQLSEVGNAMSKNHGQIKYKKNIYNYEKNPPTLPKLKEIKQNCNYYSVNPYYEREISKLSLHNLDLSTLKPYDTSSKNLKCKDNRSGSKNEQSSIEQKQKSINQAEENLRAYRKKNNSLYENSQYEVARQVQKQVNSKKRIMIPTHDISFNTNKKSPNVKTPLSDIQKINNKIIKSERRENQNLRNKIEFENIKNTLLKHTQNQSYSDIVAQKLESYNDSSPKMDLNLSQEKKHSMSKNLNKIVDQVNQFQHQKYTNNNQNLEIIRNNSIVISKKIDLNSTVI